MMELERIFQYQGQDVRMILQDGEPWWVAKDVCEILGLEQVTRAMSRLDDDERGLLILTKPQITNKILEVNAVNYS